jgi:DNA-binding beta-propeller fold protein YncE
MAFLKGARERPLASPYGVTIDAQERIYVVDTLHKAVKVFETASGKTYWFPDSPLDGFVNPIDIAIDPGGTIYVSDSGANVVHVFSREGRRYEGVIGQGLFQRPTGLLLDPANAELVVVDTKAAALLVFDTAQRRLKRTVGGRGTEGGRFNFPVAVADGAGSRRYVVDSMNFRVQVLDADFGFLRSFGTAGDAPGHFSRPKGVAVDSEGHVYVVDALFDNVQVFDPQGRLLMAFGGPGAGPGRFWLPNDIHIDAEDRIYVSDAQNRRVQVFQYLSSPAGG